VPISADGRPRTAQEGSVSNKQIHPSSHIGALTYEFQGGAHSLPAKMETRRAGAAQRRCPGRHNSSITVLGRAQV